MARRLRKTRLENQAQMVGAPRRSSPLPICVHNFLAMFESPIRIVRGSGLSDNIFTAYKGRAKAGHLMVDRYTRPLEVFKVAVKPEFQRQGVATALYQAAEAAFGPLHPSSAQTDDAFGFWMHYRPSAIPADDLRRHRARLLGRQVTGKYGTGTIISVGAKAVIAQKDNGNTFPHYDVARLIQA